MRIEINNISKTYSKTKALDGITLTFETGHIYGLLGRNGAGKTTLLRCIADRIKPTEGNIDIENGFKSVIYTGDENMFNTSEKVKRIFTVFSAYTGADLERMFALAKAFDLNVNKKWEKLSTGYSTILKDILALSSPAPFVFFDEPILGLDATYRELFYEELLKAFSEDRCFVVSTHIIEEVSRLLDKAIIIDKGKLLYNEDTETLIADAAEVSGTREAVEEAIKGCQLIRKTAEGNKHTAYVKGKVNEAAVNVAPLDLQKLFVEITR